MADAALPAARHVLGLSAQDAAVTTQPLQPLPEASSAPK
jgi:hypothetical protein